MTFDTLLGNEELKTALKNALNTRFPQTILLTGPTGSGKMTLGGILAAALLCTGNVKPCGSCNSCHKIAQAIHPDVSLTDLGDSEITVAAARSIRSDCCILPNDGEHKVYLIRHAQNMNVSAQNALLKILEEPPAYAFFILMTENVDALLPTVLSRCSLYRMSPLSQHKTESFLRRRFPNESEEKISAAAIKGQGIAGDAVSILSAAESNAVQDYLRPFLKALSNGSELDMLMASTAAEKLSRQEFRLLLCSLSTAIRDAVLRANALSVPYSASFEKETLALAERIPTGRLLKLYDFVHELDRRTDFNAGMASLTACLSAGAYNICFL